MNGSSEQKNCSETIVGTKSYVYLLLLLQTPKSNPQLLEIEAKLLIFLIAKCSNVMVFMIICMIVGFVMYSCVLLDLNKAYVHLVNIKNFGLAVKSLILRISYPIETLDFFMITRCAQILLILLTSLSR